MTTTKAEPRVRNLVFDIHGVLLGRSEPSGHLPASDTMEELRRRGYQIRFVTNTSSMSAADMAEMLCAAGIAAVSSEVFTAGTTVATYLSRSPAQVGVHVVGSNELRREISRVAGANVRWCGPGEAELVVASRALELDQETLGLLRTNRGARLVATCRDARFPDGNARTPGKVHEGPGPTVERVEQALGTSAQVLGKPNHYVLHEVMRLGPQDIAETIVVGDSVEQDVMLARNAGARWLLLADQGSAISDHAMLADDGRSAGRLINTIDEMLELL